MLNWEVQENENAAFYPSAHRALGLPVRLADGHGNHRQQAAQRGQLRRLARLDPYDESSMRSIARLLDDDEWWVRLCAVGALSTFGRKARPVIPEIQQCANTDQKRLTEAVTHTIKNIELSRDTTEQEKQHQQRLKHITAFLKKSRQAGQQM